VLVVTLVFGAVGLGLSLGATPSYTTSASIVFRDVAADLPLLGGQVRQELSPAERAARNRDLIGTEELARAAKRLLDTDVSADALSAAVTARVGVETSFVLVDASWTEPQFAADIANAFAEASVARATKEENARLDSAIDGLKDRVRDARPDSVLGQFNLSQLSQLQAVREISDPAEVTQSADVPESPSSPRTVRNTALSLLVGLAFGLVAAFTRDALDRRIRTPHDAHDELGLPVLGRIGLTAMGTTGFAENGRRVLSAADLEAFRMLRTNLAFFGTDKTPKTVLVTSGLPQEGKSTTAAALATAAAAAGQSTLLVDCDLRRPALSARLGLNETPGLAEYLAGDAKPGEILQVKPLVLQGEADNGSRKAFGTDEGKRKASESRSLVFISAGKPPALPAELLASARCDDFFSKVGRAYDLVVIDSSPILASVDPLNLASLVDAVLVCVRVSSSTREEMRAVKAALARLPERPGGIVATGLRTGSSDDYAYYGYEYIP
jgi:Mrp family chromosome partitioning ATPase/capsular polysaccharide biosynthesis protein